MAQIGKNAAVPSNMDDTMETRVLMDSIFLMKIAQYELNAKEQFQLGIFLKLPTSTVDSLIGASEDAVANTFKMLETWLNSSKDVSNSTVLFDQLTGACMEIKRADLVNSVRCEQICLLSQRLKKAKEIAPSCRRKCNEQIRLAKAEERRAKEELQKCLDEVQRLNDLVRQYGNPEEPATALPEERTEPLGDAAETPVHPEVRTHQLEAASTTPASTVDRIEALKAAAEPVDGGDNKDKKLRALHVMSMLKEYKQPKLWGYVSHHFVKKGELDVSKVLSSSNLPNLIFILTSNVTSNITKLDFGDNGIFCNEEAGHSLGAALASMSQLSLLRMPQCCVSDGSFRHIADGLLRGCHQMTLLNLQRNSLTDAGSEGRVKDLLTQMPVLTIVLTSSGLSVECGHRLRMAFGVRFLAF